MQRFSFIFELNSLIQIYLKIQEMKDCRNEKQKYMKPTTHGEIWQFTISNLIQGSVEQ